MLTTADASRFEALMDIPAPVLSRLRHPPRTSTHINARYAFFLSNAEQVRETHEAFATYVQRRELLRQDPDTSLDISADRSFAKTFTAAQLAASIRKLRLGCVNPAHGRGSKRMRYIAAALAALTSRAGEMPLSGRALQACAAFGVLTGGRDMCLLQPALRQHTL